MYLEGRELREAAAADEQVLDGGDEAVVIVLEDVRVVGRVHEALHVLYLPAERHAEHDQLVC